MLLLAGRRLGPRGGAGPGDVLVGDGFACRPGLQPLPALFVGAAPHRQRRLHTAKHSAAQHTPKLAVCFAPLQAAEQAATLPHSTDSGLVVPLRTQRYSTPLPTAQSSAAAQTGVKPRRSCAAALTSSTCRIIAALQSASFACSSRSILALSAAAAAALRSRSLAASCLLLSAPNSPAACCRWPLAAAAAAAAAWRLCS